MENMLTNLDVFIIPVVVVIAVAILVYKFFKESNKKQRELVLNWLLNAVTIAEERFGDGRGAEKLDFVYSAFATKFPVINLLISRKKFAQLVDQALEVMEMTLKEMIEKE